MLKFCMINRGMARTARRIIKPKLKVMEIPSDKISKGEDQIVFGSHSKKKLHHGDDVLETFESLQLRHDVIKGLENLDVIQPTVIQMLCVPLINQKKNVFCAAQTGSGKTLVYASPIISHLKTETDEGFINRLSRPRALVIAPSRELAIQILGVFKSISRYAPIRSLGLIGQKQKKWTREYLKGIVDVVVGTPNTILKYHKTGRLLLSDLRYIVFDEADTLMDENFRGVTKDLLNHCQIGRGEIGTGTQAILTAATLPPKGIIGAYKKHIPDLEICQSNLHKVLPHIKHNFIKTQQSQKIQLLVERLNGFLKKPTRKCIIFCNTSKASNFVSIKLQEFEIEHAKLHGNMNPKVRFEDYEKFAKDTVRVLVCTDVASRGLDSSLVTTVINYDCPFNATDYLHRTGRTGRATEQFPGEGQAITYITQNKEVLFARKVQDAAHRNKSLDEIHSKKNPAKVNYKRQLESYEKAKKNIQQGKSNA